MKMIFGAVYYRLNYKTDSLNNQQYGYYIPVMHVDKDGNKRYRMVDTYMIENTCWSDKSMAKRLWFLEQANGGETSSRIFYGCSNYYYRNVKDLPSDELDESEWELIGDLHNYNLVDDEEAREYLDDDVIRCCPLWNEDTYRWHFGGVGPNFVKKDAKKDGYLVYHNALDKYHFGFASDYYLNELEKICRDVLQNMALPRGSKTEIRKKIREIKKYRKLSKEFNEFYKELWSKKKNKNN